MADLMFYTAIPSRGAVVRWMFEEVGEPYDVTVGCTRRKQTWMLLAHLRKGSKATPAEALAQFWGQPRD